MNIAVTTTCSDGYAVFLDHLIKSILEHNPNFDKDFVVYCDPRLSQQNRDHFKSLYNKFIFHDVDYEMYQNKQKAHMKYYSIESFNLKYDRVIYWGSDMLCIQSLDELFKTAETVEGIAMPKEKRRNDNCPFNNGSMMIGPKYLNKDTYMNLLEFNNIKSPYNLTDQKLYNNFFDNIQEINQKFNVLVTEINWINWNEILMLHYMYKPTVDHTINKLNEINLELYKIWAQYDDPEGRYKRLKN